MPVVAKTSAPPTPATDTKACVQPQEETVKGTIQMAFAGSRSLTRQEQDAAENCVVGSKHTKLTIMPNHCLTPEGELQGFCCECNAADKAALLPLSKSTFAMTAIYECLPTVAHSSPYLQLVTDMQSCKKNLQSVIDDIEESPLRTLSLDCMPDYENISNSIHNVHDQREWKENMPDKLGLYHCFMRTNTQNMREHKVFIVVSGYCAHATEELYNLWLDARHSITIKQFMQCAEVSWLRQATIRHHNRLAARVAHKFGLSVRFITDISAVGAPVDMLLPVTCTVQRDLCLQQNTVLVSNDAVLLSNNQSGVVFDCWASEGYWIFMGPRDTSSYKIFGTDFQIISKASAFPCRTVRYHTQYQPRNMNSFVAVHKGQSTSVSVDKTQICMYKNDGRKYTGYMFPHTTLIQELEKLGFNLNDGITNLMPIVTYCNDE